VILHITTRESWEAARPLGLYEGDTLVSAGFIHCCTGDQLAGVLERHFPDRAGLVLLTIDPGRVTSEIRWEGGFPHVYGPLEIEAVSAATPIV
jgi:uncharacterized protein (DUF952 family)